MPLSQAAENLVGQPCQPGSCDDAQLAAGVCPPDPQLTCQLPDRLPASGGPPPRTRVVRRQTYVANARRGHMLLCPGDGVGVIGRLLSLLAYPQRFTHMGVFVDDGNTIRHSTVAQDQMTAKKQMTGSIFGEPAPVDGFKEDAIRYGWPGTITQNVDDAFHKTVGSISYMDQDDDVYDIAELSFDTVKALDGTVFGPIVVKPCLETTEISDKLRVVAHAVSEINGHYRFAAYTDAAMALDPGAAGPPMSVRKKQPNGQWVEMNTTSADPGDLCNTAREPVRDSLPVVCSSLPWLAVQLINDGKFVGRTSRDWGQTYQLLLDGGVEAPPCPSTVQGDVGAQATDGATLNGLYLFDEAQRQSAAAGFHDDLKAKVGRDAAEAIPGILADAGYAVIGAALLFAVLTGGLGTAAIAAAIGLSAAEADELVELVTNMQDHVANQMVNAFASDATGAYDTTDWESPGVGRAVGPDDIAWFWSPPQSGGLYGKNEPAALRRSQWVEEYETIWARAETMHTFMATVLRDTGAGLQPVEGATVEGACRVYTSNRFGNIEAPMPSGIYLINASYTDPVTGLVWESRRNEVDVELPGQPIEIVLVPPPAEFRRVAIYGTIDLQNKQVIHHDYWGHGHPADTAFLGPYSALNPDPAGREEGLVWKPTAPYGTSAGDVWCNVDLTLDWNEDLSISVALHAKMGQGGHLHVEHQEMVDIPEDGNHTFAWRLDDDDTNHAKFALTLENNRQS